jgi:hypothetical protein
MSLSIDDEFGSPELDHGNIDDESFSSNVELTGGHSKLDINANDATFRAKRLKPALLSKLAQLHQKSFSDYCANLKTKPGQKRPNAVWKLMIKTMRAEKIHKDPNLGIDDTDPLNRPSSKLKRKSF